MEKKKKTFKKSRMWDEVCYEEKKKDSKGVTRKGKEEEEDKDTQEEKETSYLLVFGDNWEGKMV